MNRTPLFAIVASLTLGIAPLAMAAEDATMNSVSQPTTMAVPRPAVRPPLRGPAASSTAEMNKEAAALRERAAGFASSTLPRLNQVLEKAQTRADQEITRRVETLQSFAERVGNVRMSDADKNALQATMQEQIDGLLALKEQIMSDTSTTSLKSAVQSITKSYRIFALVVPQGAITAAADRVNNIVSQMQQLGAKLAARITTAQTAGSDTATLSAKLDDFNAKVADAATEAAAAVTEVNALTPDNGDQAKLQANQKALQDAHKKIQAAEQDLVAARKDATAIVQGLRATSASSTPATASTTGQ